MSREDEKIQPAHDADGLHLWLVLWRAYDAVRDYAVRNIREQGLGLSDFAIMELLLHKGPSAVNTIGARIGLTSGSMTVAIDRLEARGLVRRGFDAADRRTKQVCLTPEGSALIEQAFAAHSEWMVELGTALTESERRQATDVLKKLGKAAASKASSRQQELP